jgi:hypothetical protein
VILNQISFRNLLPSLGFTSGRQACKILQELLSYREVNLFNKRKKEIQKKIPCHSSVINIHYVYKMGRYKVVKLAGGWMLKLFYRLLTALKKLPTTTLLHVWTQNLWEVRHFSAKTIRLYNEGQVEGGVAELVGRLPSDPKLHGSNPGASGESVGSNCEHKYP